MRQHKKLVVNNEEAREGVPDGTVANRHPLFQKFHSIVHVQYSTR
jgi:hypothetical protein